MFASISNGVISGIVIGGIISVLLVLRAILALIFNPAKDPKEIPMIFTSTETNSLGIATNVACVITAKENVLEVATATVSHREFFIEYSKILEFETIPKYDFIFDSYVKLTKGKDLPPKMVLKYIDEANIEQELQLKFDQSKREQKFNFRAFWVNNIFDYVNARMSKNNDTI